MDPILIQGHPQAIERMFGDDPGELRDDSGTIFSKNVIFVKNCCGEYLVYKILNGCNSTPAHQKMLSLKKSRIVGSALSDGNSPGG